MTMNLLLVSTALITALFTVDAAAVTPQPSDRVKIQSNVTDGFIHPGIGFTKAILENARTQIVAQRDPWISGFNALANHRFAARNAPCRNQSKTDSDKPDIDAYDSKDIEGRLRLDGGRAKLQALMYFFTGDEVYRASAMHIVRVWSKMDPTKYKNYHEAHIHASWPVQDMIVAGELLRYTSCDDPHLIWTETDSHDFSENFVKPCINTFLNWNGWFMNQSGYPCAAAMAGDIFTNDRKNYEKRVEWFTVNKDAPNKGWSASVQDLARLVDTNAITGEHVDMPNVQLVEMGRDQAHGGDDLEIFMNIARQMNAQQTKVDPITGTVSTESDAVGPYEFLNDRILLATDHFCKFMLGYETRWIPTPSDIAPDGTVRQIYPRIADNYRGRIRQIDYFDAYYYYTYIKGVDLTKKTPYYHELFTKRIVSNVTDWIYVPAEATGEAARVPQSDQQPEVVDLTERTTLFDGRSVVMREENLNFIRVTPSEAGTKLAILSCGTDTKAIALQVRTNDSVELTLSGLERPWFIPNTLGQWRYVTYTIGKFEHFRDIEFVSIKGPSTAQVDVSKLFRNIDKRVQPVAFPPSTQPVRLVSYVGAPIHINFSSNQADGRLLEYSSLDKPAGSTLDPKTGEFNWTPGKQGDANFIVNVTDGHVVSVGRANLLIMQDRASAMLKIASALDQHVQYVRSTRTVFDSTLQAINKLTADTSDEVFVKMLSQIQSAVDQLRPLTPLLLDGSVDFPKIVEHSNIGDSIGLLVDSNDDTFPVYTLAKDLNYVFDFGPDFRFSVSAFAIEGRLNFENRSQDTALFGSDDSQNWTQLTEPTTAPPTELTKLLVRENLQNQPFRYLKLQKLHPRSSPLFEPSELRLWGQRTENQ